MEKLVQKLVVSAALATLAIACGGSQPAAETPPGSAPAPAEAGTPAAFADMNRDQRMMFMKETVTPKMTEVFQKFDPKKYAEVNCATCHGKGAKDGSFTMPNPDLPKLPATPEAFKPYAEKHPEMTKFMMEIVTPTMRDLLKEEPFDPATHKGFGCGECHTTEAG